MLTPVPQQDAGNLDQPQIVDGLLLVAYQDGAALRQPAQRALHYPSSSWITLLSLQVLLLFSDASDMRLVVVALHHFPSGLFIVALVQAQMLRSLLCGFGTLHHDGIERGIAAFVICGSLVRQFEFAQNVWVNDKAFHELGNERDPVCGNHDGTLEYKIPKRPIRRKITGLPAFTTLRGGAYFFLPGLSGLRYLASLR